VDQSSRGFASEDEEATYCLSLLRDGDRHQKIRARERLSQIFERRGFLDEAAQCLETNIRDGVRDPRVYQRLAGVYRRQGRHELADEVLVEARRLAERISRPQQPGVRRPGPPRPGGPAQGVPPLDPREAPTAQLPVAPSRTAPPSDGGELELDAAGTGAGQAGGVPGENRSSPADRPWWPSPAMLVLLILLCGPFGLALMWVRGAYSKQTKVWATAIWAGLIVLMLAAAAVTLQSRVGAIVAGTAGLAGVPVLGSQPTPIAFGTPSASGAPKPSVPPGFGALPPTPVPSPGSLATGPASVATTPTPDDEPDDEEDEDEPAPAPSPTAASAAGTAAPSAKPGTEQVKVAESGGTGVNMRERPGTTGPVMKTVPEGTVLQVVGADQQMDGKAWRNVRDDEGSTGWIAAELLEPA
jgi:Bacterial SH3 domain